MTQCICTRCVMDTSDSDIDFDDDGVCNHCHEADKTLPKYLFSEEQESTNLKELQVRIKRAQNGEYDSILGLSGGVDSSYVAYLAMKMGLNPLCVHFDNGWNSDIAVKNIRNIIDKTGFDLFTYVIDWFEFRDLQRAFFKAGVIDIEMLSDHAITASLFKLRRKHKISTVLSGNNYATEHAMPPAWTWPKQDLRNIRAIQKQFGSKKLKSFPTMSTFAWALMKRFGFGGVIEQPLNLITYKKTEAMETLQGEFEWQYYGGKHYESVFTKFYQAYVLPTKFGVDKRRPHLSSLIHNCEITRQQAILELEKPLYPLDELARDRMFVLKKLGFQDTEFTAIMTESAVPHDNYSTDQRYMKTMITLGKRVLGSGNK